MEIDVPRQTSAGFFVPSFRSGNALCGTNYENMGFLAPFIRGNLTNLETDKSSKMKPFSQKSNIIYFRHRPRNAPANGALRVNKGFWT